MAVMAERPYSGANFLVTIGDADPRAPAAGFAEVVFPPFVVDREVREHAGDEGGLLVLRRGVTGSLDLYRWWDENRRAKIPVTRTVTIELLADDLRTVVVAWRFAAAYPVSLVYSPLRATDSAVAVEAVSLRFERVEMT